SLAPVRAVSVCLGDSVVLTATAGLSAYSWSPTTGLSSGAVANPTASPAASSTYTLIATDANGCRDTVSTVVTVNNLSLSPINPLSVCRGDSVTLTTQSGLSAYVWSPSSGLNSTTAFAPMASPAASCTYTVLAIDANGCRDSAQVLVTVNALDLTSSSDTSICIGGTASLQSTPGLALYTWLPVTGLSAANVANPSASPAATTTYTVLALDANGCRDSARIVVTVNTLNLLAGPDTGICPGESVQLYATPGLNSYSWTPASGLSSSTQASPVCTPGQSTVYTLTATDNNGCSNSVSVPVTVYDRPVAAFEFMPQAPSLLLPDVQFSNASVGATSWYWDFGDGSTSAGTNPVHAYDSAGTYTVWLLVSNDGGCLDSTKRVIEVKSDYAIWLPNAFTPNSDGRNEIYRSESFNILFEELLVFNRFGEVVFRSTSPTAGWDGTYQNTLSPEGTYVCLIRYRDPDKVFHEKSQHFSLIR
ncbi:MAG: PKD domain-containing protein, partial [Bacteroidota bacterium]